MIILITIVVFCIVVPLNCIIDGYVLMKLWSWFVVASFGAPAMSLPVAAGVGLIVALTTHQTPQKFDEESPIAALSRLGETLFVKPGLLLFVGWVIKTYFMGI